MKKLKQILIVGSCGLFFFAGFFGDLVYAQESQDQTEEQKLIEIYKQKSENNCWDIKNKMDRFNSLKSKNQWTNGNRHYESKAYEKELEAFIKVEKAVNCLGDGGENSCYKSFEEETNKYGLKITDECSVPQNYDNENEIVNKLIYVSDLFVESSNLLDASLQEFAATNHIPLEKGEFDSILRDNIVVRAGGSFLGSTQNSLENIFRGEIIKKVNRALGTIAILYLFVLGVKFIMARGDVERLSQLRGQFAWIALGLLVISIAEFMGYEIFNPSGNDILEGGSDQKFYNKVREIVRYVEYMAGGLMIINGMISAYGLIMSGDEDESVSKEKQFIKSFLMGTAFILMAEVIVRVLSMQDGMQQSARVAVKEIAGLVNFSLSFIGVVAVFMLILASLYYVISFGDEDQMSRAKRMIISSIIGVIVAFSSYTIIRFLIT